MRYLSLPVLSLRAGPDSVCSPGPIERHKEMRHTIDNTRQLGPPLDTAKSAPLPLATRHQLERPGRNLGTRGRNANDGRDAPAFVAALERLAHDVDLCISISS